MKPILFAIAVLLGFQQLALAQRPTTFNEPVMIDPATGDILPVEVNGHVPNLPSGTTVAGIEIGTGGGGGGASDTAFASSWNGITTTAPSKNAVYDWGHVFDTDDDGKVNVLDLGAGIPKSSSGGVLSLAVLGTDYLDSSYISDTALAASWNGVTTISPSKNSIYDYEHVSDTDDDGKINVLDIGAGIPKTNASGVISLATSGTDYEPALTFTGGLTRVSNTVTADFTETSTDTVENKSISGDDNTFSDIPIAAITGAITLNVQQIGDTAITITDGKNGAQLTAALTAARVWTLPAASSLSRGLVLRYANMSGNASAVTTTNTLSFARGGSDTINGGTGNIVLTSGIEAVDFVSDGVSKWAVARNVWRGYTVATLPATAAAGMVKGAMAYVTDATSPTYLGALTGGGAVVCPVFYNGSAWVSH